LAVAFTAFAGAILAEAAFVAAAWAQGVARTSNGKARSQRMLMRRQTL
jgi:hypothetical protein